MNKDHIAHSIIVLLIVINIGLTIYHMIQMSQMKNVSQENWSDGFGGYGIDIGNQTHLACNCAKEGIKYPSTRTMPFNNDSNLYADTIYQHYSTKIQTPPPINQ